MVVPLLSLQNGIFWNLYLSNLRILVLTFLFFSSKHVNNHIYFLNILVLYIYLFLYIIYVFYLFIYIYIFT